MANDKLRRRGYLGLLAGTTVAGLAGCSGSEADPESEADPGSESDPESESDSAMGPEARSGSDSGQSEFLAADRVGESPYTEVYRSTIDSVVLIRTSAGDRRGGQGSGFVYRNGAIVTNAHVVSDATTVQVRFARGSWTDASVVGTAPSSDLAVLSVADAPDYATPLPLVETAPAVGTEALAIGSPYGLEGSLTAGLVSGVKRSIPAPNGYTIPDGVQTSAPVNPGNSGGPLVDLSGRVLGVINSGGGDNLAFAISTALVETVVPTLLATGDHDFAYVGVGLGPVTPDVADTAGLDRAIGVRVTAVERGGPADGVLKRGDVITGVEGTHIAGQEDLSSYLALRTSPGETVTVTVVRDGRERTVDITLGARPERPIPDASQRSSVR